jgi:MFS transporter, DHA3 family, macrolide efflux protein
MIQNRHFLYLWFINITTTLAIELFTVTILVSVFKQTDSTLMAAATMVTRTLPQFLLGPIAGVLVDRFPRKTMLICVGIIQVLLVGMAILFLQGDGNISITTIFLILAGLSAADIFHKPARMSLIPTLVAQGHLVKANSFILASNQIMMAVSYTLGGWLILSFPLRQIAFGVLGLFAASVFSAIPITEPKLHNRKCRGKKESVWKAWVSGWNYLRKHPIARPLTIMETIEHLPHGIWTGAVMLAFTIKGLNGDASDWGYQGSGYFTGMILGSLFALTISKWLARFPGRIIVVNAFAAGLFTLAYAGSQTVWVAVMWAFVFGPPFAIRDVAQDSLLQSSVDKEQLGRVYATREMLRSAMFMFAGIFFAWLSDFVPIRTIYVIGGILYMLTGAYALSNKALRKSRIVPEAEQS